MSSSLILEVQYRRKHKNLKAGLLEVDIHLLAIESVLSGHWLGLVHEDK